MVCVGLENCKLIDTGIRQADQRSYNTVRSSYLLQVPLRLLWDGNLHALWVILCSGYLITGYNNAEHGEDLV